MQLALCGFIDDPTQTSSIVSGRFRLLERGIFRFSRLGKNDK